MHTETLLSLGANAALQAAIRTLHRDNPVALYSLGGAAFGITFFVLPTELKTAALSLATSVTASKAAEEMIRKEFL